jgi:hypothetical protein
MGLMMYYFQVTYLIGDLKTVKNIAYDETEKLQTIIFEATDRVCEVKLVSCKKSEWDKIFN